MIKEQDMQEVDTYVMALQELRDKLTEVTDELEANVRTAQSRLNTITRQLQKV